MKPTVVAGADATELVVIWLVALPTFLVPVAVLYLVFRAGQRRGAADAGRDAKPPPGHRS